MSIVRPTLSVRFIVIAILLIVGICFCENIYSAQRTRPKATADGKIKALLISAESHKFSQNDVENLSDVLSNRCIGNAKTINLSEKSSVDSIKKEIAKWSKSLSSNDAAILYISGDCVVSDGTIYLPTNTDAEALPVQWIRKQLEDADAHSKVILLDACFDDASSSNIEPVEVASMEQITSEFGGKDDDVVTIVCCKEDENSQLWDYDKHSLFTSCLIEAFKGRADSDNNQIITLEELCDYVSQWTTELSQLASLKEQNPNILGNISDAGKFQIKLRAQNLQEVTDDIAEQLDFMIRQYGSSGSVIVPEYSTNDQSTIEPGYGSLSRNTARNLEKALGILAHKSVPSTRKTNTSYKVLSQDTTRELLKDVLIKDYGTSKTANLDYDGETVRYIAKGKISYIDNSLIDKAVVSIEVQLFDAPQKKSIGDVIRGVAVLSDTNLGEAGESFAKDEVGLPPSMGKEYVYIEQAGFITKDESYDIKQTLLECKKDNPMTDDSIPYKVEILTHPITSKSESDYKVREGKVIGNQYYVPLKKGEEYAIRLTNESGSDVFAKVLVDGLDTVSHTTKSGKVELAPRVDLEVARSWAVENTKTICGFYEVNNGRPEQSKMYRFQYVDADKARAKRSGYTEQLGLINVAFYKGVEGGNKRGGDAEGGTGLGESEAANIGLYKGKLKASNEPSVIYSIRYVSYETFEKLMQNSDDDNNDVKYDDDEDEYDDNEYVDEEAPVYSQETQPSPSKGAKPHPNPSIPY